jgi:hypothetical protein
MYEPRFEWVDYPDADPGDGLFTWDEEYVGTKIRVLRNPTMLQVRNEAKAFADSLGTDIEKQDAYWQYVAPRIPEWNVGYLGEGADGVPEPMDLQPPAERWESLLDLPFHLAMWVRMTVHLAHVPKLLLRLQNKHAATDSTLSTSTAPESLPASATSVSTPSEA